MTPSQAVQPTTNEAAERLRDTLGGARQQWLDAALSEERRLTATSIIEDTMPLLRAHFADLLSPNEYDEIQAAILKAADGVDDR